ncbi:hypothetical protein PHAMO_340082 [Magnetospirillum molischianum DSM 120]|uniref:Uncharacterized protein n=1 Tax=Magnetospirillum molischianum DSM 120 TaxID=1150626 RepID=H8FV21_MAGML|nr:hypothetical protein PHAMO_340082 [Magnetospirillum molischianum DSM 120]
MRSRAHILPGQSDVCDFVVFILVPVASSTDNDMDPCVTVQGVDRSALSCVGLYADSEARSEFFMQWVGRLRLII